VSIHKTLKVTGSLTRARNVLTRLERIEKLKKQEKWEDSYSIFGLPKVTARVMKKRPKKKKEKDADAEAAVDTAKKEK